MKDIILIAHDIRSSHNVGSLIRTSEGLGLRAVYLTGYTPYLSEQKDNRIPHLAKKIDARIKKTSLGAELSIKVEHHDDVFKLIDALKKKGYQIVCLEQQAGSIVLNKFKPQNKLVVIIGNEVSGVDKAVLAKSDLVVEIPMLGTKESFNVVQAAAMMLYHCRFEL